MVNCCIYKELNLKRPKKKKKVLFSGYETINHYSTDASLVLKGGGGGGDFFTKRGFER